MLSSNQKAEYTMNQCTLSVRLVAIACLAGSASGCATANDFGSLPAGEQSLFNRCSERAGDFLCGGSAQGASRTQCLRAKADFFADRPTGKARRKWLEASGCPASVLAAHEAVAWTPAKSEGPKTPAAAEPAAVAVAAAATADSASADEGAVCQRSAACRSDLCVQGRCVTLSSLYSSEVTDPDGILVEPAAMTVAVAVAESSATGPEAGAPKALTMSVPDAPSPGARPGNSRLRQLREAIVAHEPEMKKCVDRQLKLEPSLSAQGTLFIVVDAQGNVPEAAVRGDQLIGTPLEGCLRNAAARWRFPSTGKAYAIEAPLRVTGSE